MTGRRYALIFLMCALLFGSAVFAVAQETVKLELKFKPGELLRYKMVMNMNISMEASEMLGKSKVAVVKQDIYGDLDFANLAQSFSGQQVPIPSGLKMKGKINGSGTTYFSTEKGQMMRTDGWADLQMALDVPASSQGGQSGSMSMKMRMDFEVFLLPS